MGTHKSEEQTPGAWQHVFRHRAAPDTLQRRYWRIPASPGWQPSSAYAANGDGAANAHDHTSGEENILWKYTFNA